VKFEQADALNRAIRVVNLKHRARAAALLGEIGLHPGQEIVLLELDARGSRSGDACRLAGGGVDR
jgi:hypothetical protein